jgi:hypothetical protein
MIRIALIKFCSRVEIIRTSGGLVVRELTHVVRILQQPNIFQSLAKMQIALVSIQTISC